MIPRRTILALALALLATGCDAGLAIGTGPRCAAEMQRVKSRHGQPGRVEEGTRSQFWVYNAERITYEFSWDQEGENCVVRSARFARIPAGG